MGEDTIYHYSKSRPHPHHEDITRRLKRDEERLRSVIQMIAAGRNCVNIAQQLQAVEKAISQAKR